MCAPFSVSFSLFLYAARHGLASVSSVLRGRRRRGRCTRVHCFDAGLPDWVSTAITHSSSLFLLRAYVPIFSLSVLHGFGVQWSCRCVYTDDFQCVMVIVYERASLCRVPDICNQEGPAVHAILTYLRCVELRVYVTSAANDCRNATP